MVTKGHDFPGVTLVGVIAADASLNFPDFRAAERTFQLLTQVAGRAGRGERPGRVLVQAFETGHYAITTALRHDYESFAARELAARRELGYPPFSHLVLMRFEGEDEADTVRCAKQQAENVRTRASQEGLGVSVLGPAPAPLARLKGLWRFQVLLKSRDRASLRRLLRSGIARPAVPVRQIVDVDPFSML
jgi:primosomal protein N' (replication factor Y)